MFPRQRLPFKAKTEKDFEWAKKVIDYIITDCSAYDYSSLNKSEYQRMLSNYRLYNNKLDQADFERECNPYGIQVGQVQDEVQPYNKTYNKIQVLLGDELLRPFNYRAVLTNADGIRTKLAHRDTLLRKYVLSQIQSTLQELSVEYAPEELQGETEKIMDPKEVEMYMSTSYMDSREILANKILSYLTKFLSLPEIKNEAFKHALLAAKEIVYVTHEHNAPKIEVINPLNFYYHASPDTRYLEDSLYAGHRQYLTSAEILDSYGPYLTKEQIRFIEDRSNPLSSNSSSMATPAMEYNISPYNDYYTYSPDGYSNDFMVHTVEWVSQKRVGFLTYINEYGDTVEDIVSEDFVVPSPHSTYEETKEYNHVCTYYTWNDINGNPVKLTWAYIPEVWTGTKISKDIYCKIGPKTHQFRSQDNPYDVKLSYHGTIYNNTNASPVSIMDRMRPFQFLYFIIMHKLKKLIAQDQGKAIKLDTSMIDPAVGWEKTMYYLKELNIEFFNPLQNAEKEGAYQRGLVTQSIDLSNAQYIMNYVNLLAAIDQQISDVAGVNRQREGQIVPGEAVTNAQANVQMSSLITELYFFQHDRTWERIITSLLQLTQSLWKTSSTVKQWVLDDLSLATLEISPDDIAYSDFATFVTNSNKEQKLFNSLEVLSDRLLQANRAKFSDIIQMYKATSIEELQAKIVASEKQTFAEQQAAQQQALEMQARLQKEQQAFELEKQEREFQHEVLIHEIDSFRFQKDQDLDNNQIPDQLELAKFKADVALKTRKLDLEEKKIEKQAIAPEK